MLLEIPNSMSWRLFRLLPAYFLFASPHALGYNSQNFNHYCNPAGQYSTLAELRDASVERSENNSNIPNANKPMIIVGDWNYLEDTNGTSIGCIEGSSTVYDQLFHFNGQPWNLRSYRAFYIDKNASSPEKAKNYGDQCSLNLGNPINAASGNKYHSEQDFQSNITPFFSLTRHYNNQSLTSVNLGKNWRAFSELRTISSTQITVTRADHKVIAFTLIGGVWVPDQDISQTLVASGINWIYTQSDDSVEIYDASGKLLEIRDIKGNIQTFDYLPNGNLDSISTSNGETLTFSFDTTNRIEAVTHSSGQQWLYSYTSDNNLDRVYFPAHTIQIPVFRQYHYEDLNFFNALTGITDERGIRYSTYEYDGANRATASYHGPQTPILTDRIDGVSITYNTGGTRVVTDSNGQSSMYTTATQINTALVTEISGPACASCGTGNTSYNYDPINNNLLSKTENNQTTAYGNYNAKGNPGYMIEAQGTAEERRTDYQYDSRFHNKVTKKLTPSIRATSTSTQCTEGTNCRVIDTVYDAFANITSHTVSGFAPNGSGSWNPVSRTTTYQYNGPLNQISQMNGPRTDVSDITLYGYYPNDPLEGNNRGRLRKLTGPSGIVERDNILYTSTGKVLSEDRPNGLTLTYTYYAGNDRLEFLTESDGTSAKVTHWTYLATGEVASVTTGHGTSAATTITLTYDDARRLTRVTDGLDNYVEYTLDTEGNLLEEKTYNDSDVLRRQITQAFDIYNRLDTNGQANESMDYNYAPDGTLDLVTDGRNSVTDYSYDGLRRLASQVENLSGLNTDTLYDYDAADRLTTVTDPNGNTTNYVYDDLGNQLTLTSPDTGTTQYTYDNVGNLKTRFDAKSQLLSYSYDALDRLLNVDAPGTADDITYSYDNCANGTGKLCSVSTPTQTVHYAYDAFGNQTRHQAVGTSYDAANRVQTMTYPSGAVVTYQYDLAGNINQVDLTRDSTTQTLAYNIAYAPLGPIESLTYGNGKVLTQTLDIAYRLSQQNTPTVLDLQYPAYDANGNLSDRYQTVNNASSSNSGFSYDALNRVNLAVGPFGARDYNHDANGNRTQLIADSLLQTYGYEPDTNRLSNIESDDVQLDPNGNTTAHGTRDFTHTAHNRIKTINDDTTLTANYAYNGLGQRNGKTVTAGGDRHFLFGSNGELLVETDGHGNILKEYIYLNGQLLAQYEPDTDGDGSTNQQQDTAGTNPTNPDNDGDTLSDRDELLFYGTSLTQADTDGDGVDDQQEIAQGTDPLNANSAPPITAPNLQTGALILLSLLFLGIGIALVKRGNHTPAAFFISLSLLCMAGTGKNNSEHPFIKSAHALPTPSGQIYFVHNDHLGTPWVLTDISGTVVWQASYDPFGKATVDDDPDGNGISVVQNVRFPGQYYDQESEYHYNYFRYYNSETGRFLTADPIGLDGGLNMFWYVAGNPQKWSDQRGLDAPGCDSVPDFFDSNCMLNMCARHDYCYFKHRCSASSWFLPLSRCNLACNLPATGGAVGAAAAALFGIECDIKPDETPRESTCGAKQ